jgi:predicted transposase/invertase (TIGR01784 family)
MSKDRPLVSFDWAAKQMLRNKANFEIVEGFLSELLKRDIKITSVLESESNKQDPDDKYDRVDVVVEDELKEVILIEIQFSTQTDYFQRMLYGVSKAITDRIRAGEKYEQIKKVYSINIVYFDAGQGEDYVYHCKSSFKGLYKKDILKLSGDQCELFDKKEPGDLYPEYYVLKVNEFNDLAENTLDEWIYFLKNNRIEEGFSAKGLLKAREALDYAQLTPEEKAEYDYIQEARTRHRSQIEDAIKKGEYYAKKEYVKVVEEYVKVVEEKDKVIEEKDKKIEETEKDNANLREEIAEMKRLLRDKQGE